MSTSTKRTAVAYYRTSSQANCGADKDSEQRQRAAVTAYAARAGFEIVGEFYDEAVSGADAVDTRAGFTAMLARLMGNGCRTIIVETANRLARDLMVQETAYAMLKAQEIELIAADAPGMFLDDGPTAKLIRQILGAVAEFDKAMTVAKLRGARDRKSAALGRRIEGNPNMGKLATPIPEDHVKAAQKAHGRGLSLRAIAAELAAADMHSASGKVYGAQSIKLMLTRAA